MKRIPLVILIMIALPFQLMAIQQLSEDSLKNQTGQAQDTGRKKGSEQEWQGMIRGQVVLDETNQPVANAMVSILGRDHETINLMVTDRSDDSGHFSFQIYQPGSYLISAQTQSHIAVSIKGKVQDLIKVGPGLDQPEAITIRLKPGTPLTLKIHDNDRNQVMAPFSIQLGSLTPFFPITSLDHSITVAAPSDNFVLGIQKPGFSLYLKKIDLSDKKPQTLDVTLKKAGTLRGSVTFADGTPATNISIFAFSPGTADNIRKRIAVTNSDGDFYADTAPISAGAGLRFFHHNRLVKTLSLDLSQPPHEKLIEVTLSEQDAIDPTYEIEGRVTDPDQTPLSNVLLYYGQEKEKHRSVVTDEKGQFIISTNVRGGQVQIVAVKSGYDHTKVTRVEKTPGPSRPVQIILEPIQSVTTGRVIDETGKPIAHVGIWNPARNPFKNSYLLTKADENGVFTYDFGPSAWLLFHKKGYITERTTMNMASESDYTVTLRSQGVIRGRVIDQGGKPVTKFRVHYGSTENSWLKSKTINTPDGRFELKKLANGETYHIAILADGETPVLHPPIKGTAKNQAPEVTIKVGQPGKEFRGTVMDTQNQPIAGAVIELDGTPYWSNSLGIFLDPPQDTGERRYYKATASDETGRFKFRNLPSKYKFQMRVTAQNHPPRYWDEAHNLWQYVNHDETLTLFPSGGVRIHPTSQQSATLKVSLYTHIYNSDNWPRNNPSYKGEIPVGEAPLIIGDLNPGHYKLSIREKDTERLIYQEELTLEPGHWRDIHLSQNKTLTGRAFIDNKPLNNGYIGVFAKNYSDENRRVTIVETDENGAFSVTLRANINYHLMAAHTLKVAKNTHRPDGSGIDIRLERDRLKHSLHFKSKARLLVVFHGVQPKNPGVFDYSKGFFPLHRKTGDIYEAIDLPFGDFWIIDKKKPYQMTPIKSGIRIDEAHNPEEVFNIETPLTGDLRVVFKGQGTVHGSLDISMPDRSLGVLNNTILLKGQHTFTGLPVGALQFEVSSNKNAYTTKISGRLANQDHHIIQIRAGEVTEQTVVLEPATYVEFEIPGQLYLNNVKLIGPTSIQVYPYLSRRNEHIQFHLGHDSNPHSLIATNLPEGEWKLQVSYLEDPHNPYLKQIVEKTVILKKGDEIRATAAPIR